MFEITRKWVSDDLLGFVLNENMALFWEKKDETIFVEICCNAFFEKENDQRWEYSNERERAGNGDASRWGWKRSDTKAKGSNNQRRFHEFG